MIVATVMAGVIDRDRYGLDEKGQVFRLDAKGRPIEPPVAESLATEVREQIKRSKVAAKAK